MSIIFGSARHDEYGNITGGAAGDQTGEEVSTQEFYMHSKGWYGYRPKSVDVANALATAMQQACDNNNIGYDQNQRGTLLTQYKSVGSIKNITTKCECDCSSLVRVCIYQASGVLLSDFDTSGEPSVLSSSGLFDKVTVNSSSDVYNGDVLVTKTKGHTGIIVSGRARSSSSSSGSGTSSSGTVESASSFDSSLAGTYTVNASDGLNIRYGAGTNKNIEVTIPNGTSVQNYGYYTTVSGTKWLLVAFTYNSKSYTGFGSSTYLTKKSSSSSSTGSTGDTSGGSMTKTGDPETIWNYLYSQIGNAYGTAGVMGNMYAESAFIPINLQDSYESKLGYTDESYTNAVDNGTYTNFVNDSAGYGLVQWTYYTLKQGLLDYCQSKKASIGNMSAQLEHLCTELKTEHTTLWSILTSATSVKEASDAMLTKFEQPADQSDSVKEKRASYGQTYYDKYAKSSSSSSGSGSGSGSTAIDSASSYSESLAGTYKVSGADYLNVRSGAGTSKTVLVTIPSGTSVQNYGYYTTVSGTKWLLIQFSYNSKTYTGFASSKYLTKSSNSSSSGSGSLDINGVINTKTTKKLQEVMGSTVDGKIDGQQSASKKYWTSVDSSVCSWSGGSSAVVKKLQQLLKDKGYAPGTVDGKLGKKTASAAQNFLKAKGYYNGSVDNYFGTESAKALQKWLNTQ